ncbi:MAG: lysylphosphatidylglycerol synthase transmembrane domain-containing protein, partial [Thermoguttaceae bacterium]
MPSLKGRLFEGWHRVRNDFVRKWHQFARLAVAAACLAFVVRFFAANTDQLRLVANLVAWKVAALAAIQLISLTVHSYQMYIVLGRCSNVPVGYWEWLKTAVLATFLNNVAPQAGNVYRAVSLKATCGLAYTRYVAVYFSFAWLDTCLGLGMSLVVIAAVRPGLEIAGLRATWLLGAALGACVLGPIGFEALWRRLQFRSRRLAWLGQKVAEMLRLSVSSLAEPTYLLKLGAAGMASFGCGVAVFYMAFQCLGTPMDLAAVVLFYVVLRLGSLVVITPGNLGIQEVAYGIISSALGRGLAEGLWVSVLVRLVGTTLVIALATPLGGFQ